MKDIVLFLANQNNIALNEEILEHRVANMLNLIACFVVYVS